MNIILLSALMYCLVQATPVREHDKAMGERSFQTSHVRLSGEVEEHEQEHHEQDETEKPEVSKNPIPSIAPRPGRDTEKVQEEQIKKAEEREIEKVEELKKAEQREVEKVEELKKAEQREIQKVEELKKSEEREIEKFDKLVKVEAAEEKKAENKKDVEETKKSEEREIEKAEELKKAEQREVEKVEELKKAEQREIQKVEELKKSEEREIQKFDELVKAEKVEKKEVQGGEKVEKVSVRAAEITEEPLNATEWIVNPCESNRQFNYFQAYPNDTSRYIQCDPWGTGLIKRCPEGLIWNMWALRCDRAENVQNSTTLTVPQPVFNCSSVGYECLNSGVCTESSLGGFKCVCRPEFTGQFCESKVDLTDLTHEILNGTFSLTAFRQQLAALNITSDAAQYERYREQLDNATYAELINYISLYGQHEIRYDTLINNLVENVLEDIYPDAAYLSTFNASTISVVELVRLIPNLLSYSRYSLERYQEVFAKYQSVLARLVLRLNETEPRLRQESTQYTRLTAIFMNQTLALINQTYSHTENVQSLLESSTTQQQQHTQMNETQVREQLRVQFNATLRATESLYQALERFQQGVLNRTEKGEDIYRMTLAECRIEGAVEVQRMLETVSQSSVQIWDSLVNYGFWYITSILSTPAQVLAQEQQVLAQVIEAITTTTTTTVATPRV